MNTITVAVAEALSKSSTEVKVRLIDVLANREVNLRVEKSAQIMDKLDKLSKGLRKISKPDVEHYDENRVVVSAVYSKNRLDEIKKLKEQVDRLEKTLIDAFEKGEWQRLLDLKIDDEKPTV